MLFLYVEFKSHTMQGFPDFPSDSSGATLHDQLFKILSSEEQ